MKDKKIRKIIKKSRVDEQELREINQLERKAREAENNRQSQELYFLINAEKHS